MSTYRTSTRVLTSAALLLSFLLASSAQSRPRSGWVWKGYKSRQLSKPMAKPAGRKRLNQIRDKVRSLSRAGKKPVVVFDIDDTLVRENHSTGKSRALYGAVKYVKSLHKAGATIVYLTARKERARAETTKMLKKKRLPVAGASHLLMNDTRLKGDLWKVSAKPRVLAHGKPLAMYDNDFTHVRNYRKMFPNSSVFRINTISRRKDPGGTGVIEVLHGFSMGRKK